MAGHQELGNASGFSKPECDLATNVPALFRVLTATMRPFLLALLAGLALPAAAADYVVDPSHTYATFEIDHMGFSTQRGQFERTSGQIRQEKCKSSGHSPVCGLKAERYGGEQSP
jgi:hypothetical protein